MKSSVSNIIKIDDYKKYIGEVAIRRIKKKAESLQQTHVVNVNSTYYGGGVAEILMSLTLIMNSLGIRTGWRTVTGRPDFFNVTKKMHNALQSQRVNFSKLEKLIYEETINENAVRMHLTHDIVVIHDPQPLPMIFKHKRRGPWIWRCHIDLSNPDPKLWKYLTQYVNEFDAVVMSIKEYSKKITPPISYFMPAIDPESYKNKPISKAAALKKFKQYKIPTDKPIVCQISRFDKWKDPVGVIQAFRQASKKVDSTLVLLGNAATDDPEGEQVFESLLSSKSDRVHILPYGDDTVLVNALQTHSDVILQKSLREGFGLTVTEAMWKGTPVIGGDVGGIRYQIKDGVNGYRVSSVSQASDRIVKLLKNKRLRVSMGKKAKESVRKNFLITRLLEQYLDLFNSFTVKYTPLSRALRSEVYYYLIPSTL